MLLACPGWCSYCSKQKKKNGRHEPLAWHRRPSQAGGQADDDAEGSDQEGGQEEASGEDDEGDDEEARNAAERRQECVIC